MIEMEKANIFYSVIGAHAGESVKQIVDRKSDEIKKSKLSLWSARIDSRSKNLVWQLPEDSKVYVLCKISKVARDPVGGTAYAAQKFIGPDNIANDVPDDIRTTFEKGKKYQAYVVEKYDLLQNVAEFDFGQYVSFTAKGAVSFAERFKCSQFQNVYGKKDENRMESCKKDIGMIMTLKYPFVVDLE